MMDSRGSESWSWGLRVSVASVSVCLDLGSRLWGVFSLSGDISDR